MISQKKITKTWKQWTVGLEMFADAPIDKKSHSKVKVGFQCLIVGGKYEEEDTGEHTGQVTSVRWQVANDKGCWAQTDKKDASDHKRWPDPSIRPRRNPASFLQLKARVPLGQSWRFLCFLPKKNNKPAVFFPQSYKQDSFLVEGHFVKKVVKFRPLAGMVGYTEGDLGEGWGFTWFPRSSTSLNKVKNIFCVKFVCDLYYL